MSSPPGSNGGQRNLRHRQLEGLLTALVIGPNLISPTTWLPKVWGGKTPKFKDLETLNRFVALVMGLHNDLALTFDQAPGSSVPPFTNLGRPVAEFRSSMNGVLGS